MRSISCGQLLSCNNRGPNGCDCDAEKMPFLLLRERNYFAFGMILGSADGCQADPVLLRHSFHFPLDLNTRTGMFMCSITFYCMFDVTNFNKVLSCTEHRSAARSEFLFRIWFINSCLTSDRLAFLWPSFTLHAR